MATAWTNHLAQVLHVCLRDHLQTASVVKPERLKWAAGVVPEGASWPLLCPILKVFGNLRRSRTKEGSLGPSIFPASLSYPSVYPRFSLVSDCNGRQTTRKLRATCTRISSFQGEKATQWLHLFRFGRSSLLATASLRQAGATQHESACSGMAWRAVHGHQVLSR